MTTAATRRISTSVAWGAFGTLAWAAFSILTAGSVAHAEEEPDGLLDSVASIVTPVVSDVVEPVVTDVVVPVVQATVPEALETVTQTVVSVPIVGVVAAPVVTSVADTASDSVSAVTAPLTDTLQSAPVSHLADPIVDAAAHLPVVGDVLESLGVPGVIGTATRAVDEVAGLLGNTVATSVPPLIDALDPPSTVPADPELSGGPGSSPDPNESVAALGLSAVLPSAASVDPAPAGSAAASAPQKHRSPVIASRDGIPGAPSVASDLTASPSPAAHAPPGSPAPSPSAGHGGSSVSMGTLAADEGNDSLRAWKRTLGAPDDDLPSSPTAETDSSPD